MKNNPLEALILIKSFSQELLALPSVTRRRGRGLKLSLLEEWHTARDFHNNPSTGGMKEWLEKELAKPDAKFFIKIFNSFFYLPVHLIPINNNKVYIPLKNKLEELFEFQNKEFSICNAVSLKDKDVAIVYADMLDTVAYASVSSLYCASRMLIYRQIFFTKMKSSSAGYVEVPIGDSLLALFKDPKNALISCLEILPYILQNDLKVVIGILYGKDFLSDLRGRPIIGRDTNLAVRLSEIGLISRDMSVEVADGYDENKKYLCKGVNTAIWIADVKDEENFKSLFENEDIKKKIEGYDLQLIKYLEKKDNVKNYFSKFWRDIGYKMRTIYAVLPRKYLHIPF